MTSSVNRFLEDRATARLIQHLFHFLIIHLDDAKKLRNDDVMMT